GERCRVDDPSASKAFRDAHGSGKSILRDQQGYLSAETLTVSRKAHAPDLCLGNDHHRPSLNARPGELHARIHRHTPPTLLDGRFQYETRPRTDRQIRRGTTRTPDTRAASSCR